MSNPGCGVCVKGEDTVPLNEKIADWVDKVVNGIILLIGIVLMLIGTYSMLDNLWIYQHAGDSSLKVYKPELNQPIAEEQQITENQVAWISVDNTSIDYPVMQGTDNAVYLNKDPYGQFSLSGSIFLDCRNNLDFEDDYSLIYGHHMEGDAMFGALDMYRSQSYFGAHRIGMLTTKSAVYRYDIFAVIEDDGTNQILFNPVRYTKDEVMAYIEENYLLYHKPDPSLKLLALSTCQGATTERLLVFGTLCEINEEAVTDEF